MNLLTAFFVGILGAGAAMADPAAPDGAVIYKDRCSKCHGESGEASGPGARALKVKPFQGDARLANMTPGEILLAIRADAKHTSMNALTGLSDAELEAAAAQVKKFASQR